MTSDLLLLLLLVLLVLLLLLLSISLLSLLWLLLSDCVLKSVILHLPCRLLQWRRAQAEHALLSRSTPNRNSGCSTEASSSSFGVDHRRREVQHLRDSGLSVVWILSLRTGDARPRDGSGEAQRLAFRTPSVPSVTPSMVGRLPDLPAWLAGCMAGSLARCLAAWLARWLGAWLPGCLAAWLPGCLAAWLPSYMSNPTSCPLLEKEDGPGPRASNTLF